MSKKLLAFALIATMIIAIASPGFAEAPNGPFTPMAETFVLDAVIGYGSPDSEQVTTGTTPETNASNLLLKDRLNIDVNWLWTVPTEQYEQKLQLSLASGNVPDVLACNEVIFRSLLESGMLVDLADAWETYVSDDLRAAHLVVDNKMLKEVTDTEGKMWAVPRGEDVLMQTVTMYYRKDWADKLGLGTPKSMKDIEAMAIAFAKNDPDGNGEADTYGIAANMKPFDKLSLAGVFNSFGSYPLMWVLKDGEVVSGTTLDNTHDALLWLRSVYAQGGIDPQFATMTGNMVDEKLIGSKLGIYYALWWSPNYPLNINTQSDINAEWASIALVDLEGNMADAINTERMTTGYVVAFDKGKDRVGEALVKMLNLGYERNFVFTKEQIAEKYPETYIDGEDPTSNAPYCWFWWPAVLVPPSMYVSMHDELNTVFKTGDTSLLRNAEYIYNYTAWKWLFGSDVDRADPKFGLYWGSWFSRAFVDGGMGIRIQMREAGHVIDDVYYGPATATEIDKRVTLEDATNEYFNRFIMGDVAEDSWSEFVANWNALGGDQWLAEVREGYAARH